MEPFILQDSVEIPYFSLSSWESEFPHLTVGFSARTDQSYNYALHVGDVPERVIENRKRLSHQLGFSFSDWTCAEQVHGTSIQMVTSDDRGKGRLSRESAFQETDGLMTKEEDVLLASFYADCVPLFFYSPEIDTVGIAHAGWKGTVSGMAKDMLQKLVEQGADRKKIQVAIGPSIGPCCYEVDEQVIQPLRQILRRSEILVRMVEPNQYEPNRWQLDLKETNKILLLEAGIHPEQIVKSNWCTSCAVQYFYSHRRDHGETGRMVAFIGKRERG